MPVVNLAPASGLRGFLTSLTVFRRLLPGSFFREEEGMPAGRLASVQVPPLLFPWTCTQGSVFRVASQVCLICCGVGSPPKRAHSSLGAKTVFSAAGRLPRNCGSPAAQSRQAAGSSFDSETIQTCRGNINIYMGFHFRDRSESFLHRNSCRQPAEGARQDCRSFAAGCLPRKKHVLAPSKERARLNKEPTTAQCVPCRVGFRPTKGPL